MLKKLFTKKPVVLRNGGHKNEPDKLIKAIENITVHDHLCLIYKNQKEQFASAIPFMRFGLERGEKCFYIIDDNTAEEVFDAMRVGGIDVDAARKKGSLTVVSKKEAYLRNGYFDPDEMIEFLTESTKQAKKEGYSALRVTGEMTWMLGGEKGTDRLIEYEAKLNRFFPKNECLALCQYNSTRFSPAILLDVIHTHPIVVVDKVVCKNFYYVPVEEFLKAGKGTSEEVDRLLKNLLDREQKEEEHQSYLRLMESMDKVNRAIQQSNNLEQTMSDVLDATLSIFDCDRVWLLYPSSSKSVSYHVPMERTKVEYPGALVQGMTIPIDPESLRIFQAAEASTGPVTFDAESKPPLPTAIAKNFGVQSQIVINIYPKVGGAYMFGMHQCSYKRVWTAEEKRLFQEIGRRLADGLTSLLFFRNLQKSEEEYRRIIETAGEGVWVINQKHETTFVNPRLLEMMGYEKKEMLGKKLDDFVVPEEMVDHLQRMQEREMGKREDYERRFKRKDGGVIWTRISATPLLNDKKQIVGAFGMITDISDRKKVEQEREQFFKFFNLSTDIMVIADPNGAFKKVNPTCENELGYSESELLSKSFIDFVHPDDKQSTLDEMAQQIKTGSSLNFENRYVCKEGKILWLSWRANYNKEEGVTYATARDITERKKAEIELIHVNRALRMVSDINQALIRAVDEKTLLNETCRIAAEEGGYQLAWVGFAEQDTEKNVRTVAQAGFGIEYLKSLHVTWADEAHGRGPTGTAIRTGKTQASLDILNDPKMLPWSKAALKNSLKSSIALPLINEGQTFGALTVYSGEINAFNEKEIKILEELAGDLAFGIATLRLRKNIEERTKEVNQLKNNFIQIVSHQLRTPLTVIRWNLGAILERQRGEVVPSQEEALRGAYAANLQIIERIDDLLAAIDIEEGRIRLEIDNVNITELFSSVCEEKLQASLLKNITYEILMPKKSIPEIEIDAMKIRDVIVRLIDNAIAYSNVGGHIVVKLFAKDHKVRFEISDSGIGIPETEQAHIFERFHRGWNAAQMKPDASGLSLFIAKYYLDIHNGTIGFSSVEKKGSTFWFELPIL